MSLQNLNKWHAAGSIVAGGTALWLRGCSVAAGATGITTITLDDAVDESECAILITMRGATSCYARVQHTSDTVKTVTTESAADGALDTAADYDFVVLRAPSNG